LSFVHVAIYWNNHHHMIQAAHKINGTVLWANIHMAFWLSLFPVGAIADFMLVPAAIAVLMANKLATLKNKMIFFIQLKF